MAPVEACEPLLQEEILAEEISKGSRISEDDDVHQTLFTTDGSLDSNGNRALKANTGGWRACPFILGNEFCERLAYYGINTNLVVYLTTVMHQGNAEAAGSVTAWAGTCYFTSFIGAFLADSYWGRYRTIGTLSIIYALGMILLTLSATMPSLKPPVCPVDNGTCPSASPWQLGVLYSALYLIAFGTGGIKPCVSTFGADQFDSGDPVERTSMASFFNWFYFCINVGALIASSVIVYVQENVGWGVGFGIPAVTMLLAICSFFFGTPLYRNQRPGGSPLTRIFQVLVAATRKWKAEVPDNEGLLYGAEDKESAIEGSRKIEHTNELRCLDKAATRSVDDLDAPTPWSLCTVTQVEEVKIFVRMLPIWASTIIYFTVYSQMSTFFVEQGLRMDTHLGPTFKIPAASLTVFDTLTIIVCVPLYDIFLVPFVRRFTNHHQGFTQIQRMGIGLVLATISMLVAALVEMKRLQLAAEYSLLDNVTDPVPMSIFWQIPQYFLVGASEVFTSIGQLEFFYDQAPDAMRSLCSALALSTVALGNYFSSFLVSVIARTTSGSGGQGWIPDNLNRGHLDHFFLLIALFSALNGLFFWVCSRGYKYKQVSV